MDEPIIWKKTPCLVGECTEDWTTHWWSVPFTTPGGLATECFHCKKTRFVEVEK